MAGRLGKSAEQLQYLVNWLCLLLTERLIRNPPEALAPFCCGDILAAVGSIMVKETVKMVTAIGGGGSVARAHYPVLVWAGLDVLDEP